MNSSTHDSVPHILIVEDEWIIALDIKQRLKKLGYHVVGIANCAEKALQLATEANPQLVLMDIYLQGDQNGVEIAAQLRENHQLPVVFLTSYADEPTLKQALSANPYGYIVKPFEDHDLSTSIQIALANHRTEQAIKQALEKEKQLNALKSQFVSFVSHEFRNPLSSILITLELLERKDERVTPEKRKIYIQRAKTAIQDMSQLIQDVLVMSEIDREQFQCSPIPLDIRRFCAALAEDFQSREAAQHTLTLLTQGCQPIEYPFYCLDAKLLQHILANLLNNAIKYSPPNSTILFELSCHADRVMFTIRDEGIGIPEKDQMYLFTPFYRGNNASKYPGTGLGLSIVKQCVEAHGGAIAVESAFGVGTAFTVTLYAQAFSSSETSKNS